MPRFHYLWMCYWLSSSRSTLKSLEALGAHIEVENGYVHATVDGRLKRRRSGFDMVTVGGTENILMAAALADGVTTIHVLHVNLKLLILRKCLLKWAQKLKV